MEAGSQQNSLPVIVHPPAAVPHSRWRAVAFHLLRLGVILAIVWLVRQQHRQFIRDQAARDTAPIKIERIARFYPRAASLADQASKLAATTVLDADGNSLGYVVQTSPQSDHVVGYSGPTNTMIAFDTENRVLGIEIIESRDTPEHVADVRRNDLFMTALAGHGWEELRDATHVDAVSGATLTSLAIIEGISFRVGGNKPSLRFPDRIQVEEVIEYFPSALGLRPSDSSATLLGVYGENNVTLGHVMRTSPATDAVMGYQGPTDVLIAFSPERQVLGLEVRASYDNEPYVGYVRGETYFRERFNGLTIEELSKIDIDAMQVEGVSGATMTSMAMARGLPLAAQAALRPQPESKRRFVFATRDAGTLAVLAAALAMSFSRLRGYRALRIVFQLVLIGYFGFLNGDMLSQALLVGWAQSGVPWRLAPGLMLLAAASLLVPAASKKQPYCHHICPFGAAQQLIRTRLPWRLRLRRPIISVLEAVPAALLVVVLLTAMFNWRLNLAGIEPFDAFFFLDVVSIASLVIALAGLAVSAIVPMAYCRFGCPTGALLNHLRYNASSDRWTRRDGFAMGMLLLAGCIHWYC